MVVEDFGCLDGTSRKEKKVVLQKPSAVDRDVDSKGQGVPSAPPSYIEGVEWVFPGIHGPVYGPPVIPEVPVYLPEPTVFDNSRNFLRPASQAEYRVDNGVSAVGVVPRVPQPSGKDTLPMDAPAKPESQVTVSAPLSPSIHVNVNLGGVGTIPEVNSRYEARGLVQEAEHLRSDNGEVGLDRNLPLLGGKEDSCSAKDSTVAQPEVMDVGAAEASRGGEESVMHTPVNSVKPGNNTPVNSVKPGNNTPYPRGSDFVAESTNKEASPAFKVRQGF